MRKLAVIAVLLLALMLGSTVAYAGPRGVDWAGDPIFSVEGTTVNVLIEAEEELNPSEVSVVLRVPRGVEAGLVDSHGFQCEVVQRGRAHRDRIPVVVTVRVPRSVGRFDVRVTVQVPEFGISESRDGRTGRRIKVRVNIPIDD